MTETEKQKRLEEHRAAKAARVAAERAAEQQHLEAVRQRLGGRTDVP